MLEHTLCKDDTAVPASTPAEDRKRAVTAEPPPENTHSSRYLAAGDYWFNNDSARDGEGPNNRLHTTCF